jgi:glutathione S-transferase
MALKLYYVPRTRSSRPRWLLEEMELPHELIRIDPKHKPEGYETIHPLSHVPVLIDGDTTIFESAAICLHLADKVGEPRFSPATGTPERAHYYQWLFYGATELEPHLVTYAAENRRPEGEKSAPALDAARFRVQAAFAPLEALLKEHEFLVGKTFTAADVVVGSLLEWAKSLRLAAAFPRISAYSDRLRERPAAVRALKD